MEFEKNSYNKVFFTSKKEYADRYNCCYWFEKYKNREFVDDDIKCSLKYINIKEVLNSLKDF